MLNIFRAPYIVLTIQDFVSFIKIIKETRDEFIFKKFKIRPFKVSHLPEKILFICFNESPLKTMKNAFHLILKALFVLKMFKFLS